jgi:hypothetical protein
MNHSIYTLDAGARRQLIRVHSAAIHRAQAKYAKRSRTQRPTISDACTKSLGTIGAVT